jgi:peroxiredoxin
MHAGRRTTLAWAAAAALGAALWLAGPDHGARAAPQVGAPAPGFTGTDSTGARHRLSDYRGRTVVLEWTNHLCPYTAKHYRTGNMQRLQAEAAKRGVVWLSVISSAPGKQGYVSPSEADRLTESRGATPAAVLLDPEGEIGRLYRAKVTPHMFVIDADGALVYMGAIDDAPSARESSVEGAHNYVLTALDALAAGHPVDPAITRAYGCTVKY